MANIEAKDGGKAIAAGNARVLSARLNDARFFWAKDLETPLFTEERKEKLKGLVFHAKLGSVWDKVERVAALARELAPACGADPDLCEEAARLCKMDLVTETVGEFPELQGQVGRQLYEALGAGGGAKANPSIAAAIEDHYRPLGPNDRVPTDPVAVTLALADKLDSLAGFWAIDEKPTGSGDAYGSRRAALGVVRIALANGLRIVSPSLSGGGRGQGGEGLWFVIRRHALNCVDQIHGERSVKAAEALEALPRGVLTETALKSALGGRAVEAVFEPSYEVRFRQAVQVADDLLAFLADRMKVQLRDQGKRHDLVDAVFALGDDDLVRIVAKVEALDAFLKTDDGKTLLAGYKRAANILTQEEKKQPGLADQIAAAAPSAGLLEEPAEKALFKALQSAVADAREAMAHERFADAMKALAALRAPVDAMLDGVLVNAKDDNLRLNRLRLLADIRSALHSVADFSKIEG